MATLTGKTIGQLALLTGITSDTLFAVEYSGMTFHIPYSGLSIGGGGSYEEVTYEELYSLYTGGTLTQGGYYLITDFQSIYDQPDFDNNNNPIITGNSKTGITEPLLVLATSSTTLSNQAFSPLYPKDKITYDITFTTTEISNTPAKGRITERIDEFNNRTDYNHREVLFRRYDNYYYKETNIAEGTIELIQNTGEVIGAGTIFSNYNVGDYIAIPNSNEIFFEIVSISGDTSMVVTGITIPSVSAGASFYLAQRDGLTYKQNNISIQYTEHPTFLLESETIISNYIGDVASFIVWGDNTFLLGNNVFGEDVIGNRIGNQFRNNTFESDVEHNVIGDEFENNTIYNGSDFTDNQIAANFRNNLIICDDFNDNVIGDNFNNNKFFNYSNFVDNEIGVGFNNNTIYNDFWDNKIANGFYNNVIDGQFNYNSIGNEFYNNVTDGQFNYNSIGNNFINNIIGSDFGYGGGQPSGNIIYDNFENNTIGKYAYNNVIGNNFTNNTVGDNFENNTIQNNFENNVIDNVFENNKIGNNFIRNTIGLNFISNTIGDNFGNNGGGSPGFPNTIFDNFQFNQIGNNFGNDGTYSDGGNLINSGFTNNVIGDEFTFNLIDADFTNNKIGNQYIFNLVGINFVDNQINNVFVGNTIIDNLQSNKIGNYFGFNTISNNFKRNVVGDFFGNAGSGTNNSISDDFTDNQIGNFFGNDGSNLAGGNTISNSFTKNQILSTKVYGYDFTPATYVYDSNMTKIIFDRQDGTPRLSYYDNSDVLNITNIDN